MAHFKLTAKQGTDPTDGLEIYLVVLYDDTGTAVGAGAWNINQNNGTLVESPQSFLIALSLGLADLRRIDDEGHALIAAASDWTQLWEGETEGDIEGVDSPVDGHGGDE